MSTDQTPLELPAEEIKLASGTIISVKPITVYLIMRSYPCEFPEFAGMVFITKQRAIDEVDAMNKHSREHDYTAEYSYEEYTAT